MPYTQRQARVLAVAVVVAAGCGSRPRLIAPIPSPSGKLTLVPGVNASHADPATYGCVQFAIRDSHGKALAQVQTHAADRMRWTLSWQGDDRVVLDSSDIGTMQWQRGSDGKWKPASP